MRWSLLLFELVWPVLAATASEPARIEPSYRGKPLTLWVHALAEPNVEIRIRAAEAIGHIGFAARSAAGTLAELLKDPDRRVRAEAARALGQFGPGGLPALGSLTAALSDPDPEVRQLACAALGEIGPDAQAAAPRVASLLVSPIPGPASSACRTLGQMGPGALPVLTRAIASHSAEVTLLAAQSLSAMGPKASMAATALVERLRGETDPAVKSALIDALGAIGAPGNSALDLLVVELHDSEADVRRSAAGAIGRIGSLHPRVVSALESLLNDPDRRVRLNAAGALAVNGQAASSVAPVLVEAANDPDADTRSMTLRALGQMHEHSPAALAALVAGLDDGETLVRAAAIEALGQIGQGARTVAGDRLRLMLQDPSSAMRLLSARALWRIERQPQPVLPVLLQALGDGNWPVRDNAATLVGEMGSAAAESASPLRAALRDPIPYVRIDAAIALWKIEESAADALPVLMGLIGDRDQEPYVRELAISAVAEIGPPARDAVKLLTDASGDEFAGIREAARIALAKIGEKPRASAPQAK